jgi:chromate transporter
VTAVGGPAAHVAMMHDEVVRRRGWLDDREFVDLVGATNLVPGPNSTELAMYLGWTRARGRGLVVAGLCFIVPAALLVGGLAWLYVTHGETPALAGVLLGLKPVVLAVVLKALSALVPVVARTLGPALLALGAAAAFLLGVPELLVLATAGVLGAVGRLGRADRLASWVPLVAVVADVDLRRLFLVFLRIGATLYGSGYVLLAFVHGELVERRGWITDQQLLDAVAVGQVTPGPVFTTATFLGYLVSGPAGAVVATVGIFLPSFVFVALLTRLVERFRRSSVMGAALDAVNAASIGLMAAVGLPLAGDAVVGPLTLALFVVSALVLFRTAVGSAWLLAAGGLVGAAVSLLG